MEPWPDFLERLNKKFPRYIPLAERACERGKKKPCGNTVAFELDDENLCAFHFRRIVRQRKLTHLMEI